MSATAPVLPPMLARMTEPEPIVIPDVARAYLTSLLDRYDRATEWGARDAADLSQLVEAMRWKAIAKTTWANFHDYAAGLAGVDLDGQVDAVERVCRQIRSEMKVSR